MQNKLILLAVLAAVSVSATAAPTLADLAEADAQLKMAELQAKVNEAKAKADQATHPFNNPATTSYAAPGQLPVPVANTVLAGVADDTEEVHLEAIYGVGGVLRADVSYNGSSTTLSMAADGVRRVGPWTLHEISPYRVVLTRAAKKKGDKQSEKEMFVSSNTETSDKSEKLNLNTSPTTMPSAFPGFPGAASPALPPVPFAPQARPAGMPGLAPAAH
jgi:opacity protein-like surface antigen